jgi:hypothetical protein
VQYARRANAVEIDPVTLPLDTALAAPGAPMFPGTLEPPISGGIRDAAPDAWGRRLIEARLRVPANSLPESTYLLNVGRQRAGALDIRTDRNDLPEEGDGESVSNLDYLLEAAWRKDCPFPCGWRRSFAPDHAARERRVPFVSALTLVGCSEHDAPQKSYHDIAAAELRRQIWE